MKDLRDCIDKKIKKASFEHNIHYCEGYEKTMRMLLDARRSPMTDEEKIATDFRCEGSEAAFSDYLECIIAISKEHGAE